MAIEQAQRQEYAKQYGQLVARAWGDAAFKQRLLAEPKAVLAEQGIPFPPEVEVRVHEDSPTTVHLALPPAPRDEPADMPADQAQMNPYGPRYLQLAARAWSDPAFKARLLAEPAAALAEQGIAMPPGVELRVHENDAAVVHLTLPPAPGEELSDEQLDAVAGGDEAVSTVSSLGTLSCPASTAGTAGSIGSVLV
jgi:hypothetical protein